MRGCGLWLCLVTVICACVAPEDDDLAATEQAVANYRYVDCELGVDLPGRGSSAVPWASIGYAVQSAPDPANWVIRVVGDRMCNERVRIDKSNLTIAGYGSPAPIIDGTGLTTPSFAVFEIAASYVTLRGLEIVNGGNNPGWAVEGVAIRARAGYDGVEDTADDLGSDHVVLDGNYIHSIDRIPDTCGFGYGLPVIAYSHANQLLSQHPGTPTRNLQIINNTFGQSDVNQICTGQCTCGNIFQSMINIGHNVTDWEVRGNLFGEPWGGWLIDTGGGVQVSGNQSPHAVPNYPRNGVISNNVFRTSLATLDREHDQGSSAIYFNGGQQILIERNYFDGCTRGIGVHTEALACTQNEQCAPGFQCTDNLCQARPASTTPRSSGSGTTSSTTPRGARS